MGATSGDGRGRGASVAIPAEGRGARTWDVTQGAMNRRLDGAQHGQGGDEITFSRRFYRFTPPRLLVEIHADLKQMEAEMMWLLREATT